MVGIVKAKNLKENKMLFEIIRESEESRDASKYLDILHDDFVSISHASGTQMNKAEIKPFIEKIFDQKELSFTNPRCLYENEDILVRHQIMTFADGSKEAVMVVQLKKDGKIIKSETGATPLK